MKWIKDNTGRFPERPYYEQAEIDYECEQIVSEFLRQKYGKVQFPISTDDATIMIERDTSGLDLYADLSLEGEDLEGATDFFTNKKPFVSISERLSNLGQMQNRLRSTLMHEYGHVKFHDFLWKRLQQRRLIGPVSQKGPRCKRSTILNASKTDWLEWQAGYASGALLMPITFLKKLAQVSLKEWGLYGTVSTNSGQSQELISRTTSMFSVSADAAKVRLSQLGYLSDSAQSVPLL